MDVYTPIILNGYAQWVHPWRIVFGDQVFQYGEDFNSQYCPVTFHDPL